MKTFGLVTVLYNSATVLEGFFDSLKSQDNQSFVLYAIDNASADDSVKMFESLAATCQFECKLYKNGQNLGVAQANNQGIQSALDYGCANIVLLNNDIEFPDNTLSAVLAAADSTGCAMVAPKIKVFGTESIWFAGGGFSAIKGISTHWHYGKDIRAKGLEQRTISYATTCFVLVRAEVFSKVGLMDSRYFVYYDDTDFMYRARCVGVSMLYFPDVVISHKVSVSTGGETSAFTIRFLYRNRILFLRLHYPPVIRHFYYAVFALSKVVQYLKYSDDQRRVFRSAIGEGLAFPVSSGKVGGNGV